MARRRNRRLLPETIDQGWATLIAAIIALLGTGASIYFLRPNDPVAPTSTPVGVTIALPDNRLTKTPEHPPNHQENQSITERALVTRQPLPQTPHSASATDTATIGLVTTTQTPTPLSVPATETQTPTPSPTTPAPSVSQPELPAATEPQAAPALVLNTETATSTPTLATFVEATPTPTPSTTNEAAASRIIVEGVGVAADNVTNPALRERSALLAAEVDAKRKLAEWIAGAEIESITIVDQGTLTTDTIRQTIKATVPASKVIEQDYDSAQGTARVTLEVVIDTDSVP